MTLDMIRYLWAGPNTLLGLLAVPLALSRSGCVQVVDGVMEAYSPAIALMLKRCVLVEGGACAITFGHVVLGRDRQSLETTRAHERVHVRQYELWGPFFLPAYLLASLWGLVTRTGMYYGNCFERQAMEADAAVLLSAHISHPHPR